MHTGSPPCRAVVIYPTRNFAWSVTCGPLRWRYCLSGGLTSPSISLRRRRVRAISSSSPETGKRVGVWSLRILNTSEDFRKFIVCVISAISMRPDTVRCLRSSISSMTSTNLAKFSLRRSQCVRLEERDDHVPQVTETCDLVADQILPMVVMPAVDGQLSATEERNHLLQDDSARGPLNNGEGGLHLPSEGHRAVPRDGTAETAFPVYETHQPSVCEESFLLIVRTGWIFTAHRFTLNGG